MLLPLTLLCLGSLRCEFFCRESCSALTGDPFSVQVECGACDTTSPCNPNATDFPSGDIPSANGIDHETKVESILNPSVIEMYNLSYGTEKPFDNLAGFVVIVVNTASGCAFADETHRVLNKLYKQYFDKGLRILAFPSNDFGQENRDSAGIIDFFVDQQSTFDSFATTTVVNGPNQHPIFQLLQNASRKRIQWNYEIFLISRNAELLAHWPSGISLLESARLTTLKRALAEPVRIKIDATSQTSV